MNWWGVITAVVGIGVSAVGQYMMQQKEEEKAEEMKALLQEEAALKAKYRDMQTLAKQQKLEKTTRARKAAVANLMYNRGFSAEAIRDPFKRLETEFGSATKQLEESYSLAGSIDDITLAQAELQATPSDGLASMLTSTAGDVLTITGGAMAEIGGTTKGTFDNPFTYSGTTKGN